MLRLYCEVLGGVAVATLFMALDGIAPSKDHTLTWYGLRAQLKSMSEENAGRTLRTAAIQTVTSGNHGSRSSMLEAKQQASF